MPHMMALVDIAEQLEKIDQQIIHLLDERKQLCMQSGGLEPDQEEELIGLWMEEGAERGMDEGRMEKLGKLIVMLCRRSKE